MSEEILKALMQLFAIIAKQDGVLIENHEKYVFDFLATQLSVERVSEYLDIYNQFLNESKGEPAAVAAQVGAAGGTTEVKERSRTSMKDSVRTLAICKKINKTLEQKQKFIVLTRLLEFFKNDVAQSVNRIQIVETVADVFNIEKNEFLDIKQFVFEANTQASANEIIIRTDAADAEDHTCAPTPSKSEQAGICRFIHVKSINVVMLKYHGNIELFLNGIVIKPESIYLFPPGSTLRLPQRTVYYSGIISRFLQENTGESFSFTAHITEHRFPNGAQALHELKIEENSGTLVGIMGASGSGKTTLLTLLSGLDRPSNGDIRINDVSLNDSKEELNGVIGFVPQDDLLIEDLTVYQNLYFNAKLCFKDLNEAEIEARIDATLVSLGLDLIKNIKVGSPLNKKISGGQRKRLNIALELIREPNILFLDEPTSGLSSRDSENVMDLLKELTLKGKLIFVVIHQPSSDIFKMFDKMLILDTGGYAAYYGNPIEGIMYFKKVTHQINSDVGECYACGSVNPEIIFNLIELKEVDEYGNYTHNRKIKPQKFYEYYREKFFNASKVQLIKTRIKNSLTIPGRLKQTKVFFLRDLFSKLANRQYIFINLLEVPVLALFLSLIIRYIDTTKSTEYTYFHNYNIPAYFFMSIIVALLVGLTISAEEIYKDQKILKREKNLHLSRFSYLLSKVCLLFIISCIQTLMFVAIGNLVLGISGSFVNFSLMLFSVFCFSNILGLILSSTFNSPVTIYIIIPLVIIPQLILGGAMFSYNKLNALFGGGYRVPMAANMMVSRWAYEGIAVDMFTANSFERPRFMYDKIESKFNYKLVYLLPKMEGLAEESLSKSATPKNYDAKTVLVAELKKEAEESRLLGFKTPLPNMSDMDQVKAYIAELKAFYNDKFVSATNMKDEFLSTMKGTPAKKAVYDATKYKYYNNQLEETLTNSAEKEKIVVEDNHLIQVIDPIYRDPSKHNTVFGWDTHFFSATKYFFQQQIPTFYFNLIVIWAINVLLFVLLYFDIFKKLLGGVKMPGTKKA